MFCDFVQFWQFRCTMIPSAMAISENTVFDQLLWVCFRTLWVWVSKRLLWRLYTIQNCGIHSSLDSVAKRSSIHDKVLNCSNCNIKSHELLIVYKSFSSYFSVCIQLSAAKTCWYPFRSLFGEHLSKTTIETATKIILTAEHFALWIRFFCESCIIHSHHRHHPFSIENELSASKNFIPSKIDTHFPLLSINFWSCHPNQVTELANRHASTVFFERQQFPW